jgi:oligoendopeptidase F
LQQRPARGAVPADLTWDLSAIYADPAAWEADLARLDEDAAAVAAFRGRLEHAADLLGCLRARDALAERMTRVAAYASLHAAADGTDSRYQAWTARVGAASARVAAETAFVDTEVLAIPDAALEAAYRQEPDLSAYRRQIEEIRARRAHALQPETERALGMLADALAAPSTIYHRAVAADLDFPPVRDETGAEVETSVSRLEGLMLSRDRGVRERAYAARLAGLRRHRATLAATLAAMIRRNVDLARLRGYGSAEAMFLEPQHVPAEVYHNVLDVIHDEISPHVRRLVRLRQRLHDIPAMRGYDLGAPLDPSFNPGATFRQGQELIRAALRPLGDEYGQILAEAFANRWVDLAENAGKGHGAFCHTVYGVRAYVLMTWTDRMRNVFTLAHELGHAAHGMLAARSQRIGDTRAARFFIEAPSTANELLLGRHILATTDDPRMRRWVLTQFLGTFIHNMVTHLLQGHLERRLYALAEAGKPLTLAAIADAQGEIYERFYGGAVEVDEGMRLDWMTVPHYYTGLYPFTYAAGLACGHGVAEAIEAEGAPAAQRWIATLKAGGTRPPLELMRMAGVDMTSPEPLRRAVAYFGRLVREVEAAFAPDVRH